MNAQQVINAAQILYDEFKQMKLNDVVLCFNKIKRGHYGIIYDRLDVHVIMEKMHRFDADQTEQIEYYRQKENKELQRDLDTVTAADNQKAIERLRKLRESIGKNLPKPTVSKSDLSRDKFSKYFALFHKLAERYWQNKGGIPGGKVFTKRYGKMLDVTEYVQHKAYQMQLARERFPKIWN